MTRAAGPVRRRRFDDSHSLCLLQSSTASLSIPEIGLDLGRGQLGRQFIKVGALLSQIYADLERSQRIDDDDDPFQAFMQEFRTRLDAAADFSIVIDDPFGRSLVSGVNAANIAVREYARAEGIPAAATTTLSP